MKETLTPESETKPLTSDGAPPCWPPLAHIYAHSNGPLMKGSRALCGAKLMGLNLDGTALSKRCERCTEIDRALRESGE